MMVPVRFSRYTHELIKEAQSFTVSAPLTDDLKKALILCGTKSGSDMDKISASGLVLAAPQTESFETPVIAECKLHIECKIVYKQAMDLSFLDAQIVKSHYENGDEHVLYYGEIVAAYYSGEQGVRD